MQYEDLYSNPTPYCTEKHIKNQTNIRVKKYILTYAFFYTDNTTTWTKSKTQHLSCTDLAQPCHLKVLDLSDEEVRYPTPPWNTPSPIKQSQTNKGFALRGTSLLLHTNWFSSLQCHKRIPAISVL